MDLIDQCQEFGSEGVSIAVYGISIYCVFFHNWSYLVEDKGLFKDREPYISNRTLYHYSFRGIKLIDVFWI